MEINDDNIRENENRIKPLNISDQIAIATGYKFEKKTECLGVTLNQDNPAPFIITQLSYSLFEDYHALNHCQL